MAKKYPEVVEITREYYNSQDADNFYSTVWGKEDMHLGIYQESHISYIEASQKTVETMASMVTNLKAASHVLDIGSGFGGSARYLAKKFGCRVTCLNLSELENEKNRTMNREQGVADLVTVIDGSYEDIPYPDENFDAVWSQDAMLHSSNRRKIFEEVARVLRNGGQFIFTDPMQKPDCPADVLEPVLARVHLESMGSFEFYRQAAADAGLHELAIIDLSQYLPMHYGNVLEVVEKDYDRLIEISSKKYIDSMIEGMKHWIDAGNNGYLTWGILHFRK